MLVTRYDIIKKQKRPENCSICPRAHLRFRRGNGHVNRANAAQEDGDRNAKDAELVQNGIGAPDLKQEIEQEQTKHEIDREFGWEIFNERS